jgi:hypothetical protein
MPGAGSFAGFPLDSAVGGSGKTNAAEFHYVGRVNTSAWSWSTARLWRPMAEKGINQRLPPPKLSGRCGFGERTIAETRGNGEDAPKPDFPGRAREPRGSLRLIRCLPVTCQCGAVREQASDKP